jgi:hypothetical protein
MDTGRRYSQAVQALGIQAEITPMASILPRTGAQKNRVNAYLLKE